MTAVEREKAYWDNRYARGGTSGRSPEDAKERNTRLWAAIEEELLEVDHVIDVGCGDLRIWGDRDCQDYVGIDISQQVLTENEEKRPHWEFLHSPAEAFIPDLTRANVFCFNMIYHILDPENVKRILRNLCRYATERVFIYTWFINPLFPRVTDGEYQHYHPMAEYILLFNEMGFTLTSIDLIEKPSALYVYQRLIPLNMNT